MILVAVCKDLFKENSVYELNQQEGSVAHADLTRREKSREVT
jgi:hypothetical protein